MSNRSYSPNARSTSGAPVPPLDAFERPAMSSARASLSAVRLILTRIAAALAGQRLMATGNRVPTGDVLAGFLQAPTVRAR